MINMKPIDTLIAEIQHHEHEGFIFSCLSLVGIIIGYSFSKITDLLGLIIMVDLMLCYGLFCSRLLFKYFKYLKNQ